MYEAPRMFLGVIASFNPSTTPCICGSQRWMRQSLLCWLRILWILFTCSNFITRSYFVNISKIGISRKPLEIRFSLKFWPARKLCPKAGCYFLNFASYEFFGAFLCWFCGFSEIAGNMRKMSRKESFGRAKQYILDCKKVATSKLIVFRVVELPSPPPPSD